MDGTRISIEYLKKEIVRYSPKEKIKEIKRQLNLYNHWKYKEDRDYTPQMFEYGFYEEAEAILAEIENDTSPAYGNDLNFYFNPDNIPNQDSIFATRTFVEITRNGVFETLLFFNLLFKQKDLLKDNIDKPFDFINSLKALPYNDEQLHLLFCMLLYWNGGDPERHVEPKYKTILKLIEQEFLSQFPQTLTQEKQFYKSNGKLKLMTEAELMINEKLNPKPDIKNSKYLKRIEIDFEGLPAYVIEKGIINNFENWRPESDDDYNQWKYNWLTFFKTIPQEYILKTIAKGIEYGKKCYAVHLENECSNKAQCQYNESWERRISIAEHVHSTILKETGKIPQENSPENLETEIVEPTDKGEFTTARQVLAIHYLFEICQVKNVDNTAKARFIQFLTGKQTDAKSIKNTSIYKRVLNPFSTDNKTLNSDLQYIRKYFEDLGLTEISKMITNEISKSE